MMASEKKDVSGYVSCISPSKQSAKRNQYFDIEVQTSPLVSEKVRVMETVGTKRATFVKACEQKSPMKLSKLSVSKNLSFFNSNTGSRIEDLPTLNFAFTEDLSVTKVKDISTDITGCLTVLGEIRWIGDIKDVEVGTNLGKVPRKVRDGMFADDTGFVPISIWGELIEEVKEAKSFLISKVVVIDYQGVKIQTISSSQVTVDNEFKPVIDWTKAPFDLHQSNNERLVCGKIVSFCINRYPICVNNNCGKKVSPLPGDTLVKCSICQSKMKVSTCKNVISCNLLLEDLASKQHDLVIFQNVINDIFNNKIPKDSDVENYFFNLDEITVRVNFKDVIVSFEDM